MILLWKGISCPGASHYHFPAFRRSWTSWWTTLHPKDIVRLFMHRNLLCSVTDARFRLHFPQNEKRPAAPIFLLTTSYGSRCDTGNQSANRKIRFWN